MSFSVSFAHNQVAARTARTLGASYAQLSNSVRRLASGLRVNSASDDAAGLAIRELMRSDISALNQGIRNANDAISMIQVADGALGVIDEKLIRMKELAEQAATGTYNSTQRLMIDSEFQAMSVEIDRIANATDFNGVKLLDGALHGRHKGGDLVPTGAMKVHFGPGNDSAEDYYYIDIPACTATGLMTGHNGWAGLNPYDVVLNDMPTVGFDQIPTAGGGALTAVLAPQGEWRRGDGGDPDNYIVTIPAGTKNVVINTYSASFPPIPGAKGDNDIQLFTRDGVHLAGTGLDDFVYTWGATTIDDNQAQLGFTSAQYDGTHLNAGLAGYDGSHQRLNYTSYNGMRIGYSGDPELMDDSPNDGSHDVFPDFEILTIDETTEELVLWLPGAHHSAVKAYWDVDPVRDVEPAGALTIETQQLAQRALPTVDKGIVRKDNIRAHLGAMQNRLENTVSNLQIQSENLQAAESRISDTDVATEMTQFVRSQILTQSGVAMLAQANSLPQALMRLVTG